MSANQSNLSAGQYGYDFVVATTQASINATMKEYLSGLGTEVAICYIADPKGNPTAIDYATLKEKAGGSDPFIIPNDADPATNQDLKNLQNARFMVGFKAQIGLPPGIAPQAIPDIVTLGTDTSAVAYNLMCSEFIVVQYSPVSGYSPASWMNQSQPPGTPWLFTSKVDLRLSPTDQSAYDSLPAAVQAAIKNLDANAFSVQQLLFDLDNAALQSTPTITGVDPGTPLYTCLQQDFVGKYFSTLKKAGEPVLGYAVTQGTPDPSTLHLTDLNLEVDPFVGTNGQAVANPTPEQQDLFTLNYLCAANGNRLPPPVQFPWNWVDNQTEQADFDGVVAVNRNAFVNYFKNQLASYVSQNCYNASVRLTLSGMDVDYSYNLAGGQTPTVTAPATGTTVLYYSYHPASVGDKAGLNGDLGQMDVQPSFDLSVTFSGDAITVEQHLVIFVRIQVLATSDGGNVVDKTITDTYTLAVDDTGQLATRMTSTSSDQSRTPAVNGFLNFFTGVNALIANISAWTQSIAQTSFTDIPVSVVQNFVFPGGKTFVFKDALFSDNQDLVAHITYAEPS